MNTKWWLAIALSAFLGAGTMLLFSWNDKKSQPAVYILTQQVFEDYTGTIELKKKLVKTEEQQKQMLDSIALEVKLLSTRFGESDNRSLKKREQYNRIYNQLASANQQQMEKYNEGLWKQINQYMGDYGREKGYSFIYGANGNGSIMFADSSLNISKEATKYINQRYAGE
jgi:outer membrane protein